MTRNDDTDVSRRSVLRKGAATAGVLAVGGVATSATTAAQPGQAGGKRGGRAQVDGEALRNEPFTVSPNGTTTRHASCMSAQSAMQTYLCYNIQYCNSDKEATLYVIPDESELVQNEVYEIHSVTTCRANDLQKVALGPSNESC